ALRGLECRRLELEQPHHRRRLVVVRAAVERTGSKQVTGIGGVRKGVIVVVGVLPVVLAAVAVGVGSDDVARRAVVVPVGNIVGGIGNAIVVPGVQIRLAGGQAVA